MLVAYAPHSGHDLESSIQPFWASLETYLSTIPQPESLYLVGDFNFVFGVYIRQTKVFSGLVPTVEVGKPLTTPLLQIAA